VPFEGENAVQVVAHAVNQKPKPLTEFRQDVPPGLERVVTRCLAKEPAGRYADYQELRNALLPFSSQVPEPAKMEVRALAGWIDYLLALVVPYVVIMLSVGGAQFQLQPLVDHTLYSARYYFLLLGLGFLYFGITEGFWGAGLGKRLLGLSVVRTDRRLPGLGRALLRLFIPIFCIEIVRIPLLFATISLPDVNAMTSAQVWLYVGISNVCPWLAVLLALRARRENGFATVWDKLSGTRVVVQLKGQVRAPLEPTAEFNEPREDVPSMGPYQVVSELVSGKWIVAFDPLLRRPVWLIRQGESALPLARKNVARIGRLRWLQTIEAKGARWNAFEATPGTPFSSLVKDGKRVLWKRLRQWLHDLAAELWAATSEQTLPAELSLDHVWITRQGQAVLLDQPWPEGNTHSERIRVDDLGGQQRFLSAVAACAESTTLPLHARPVLQNLAAGKFEKLSFLAGNLRGLLDKPAEVTRQIRAGTMLLLPVYIWIMVFIGYERPGGGSETNWSSDLGTALATAFVVLGVIAVVQLLELPFRSTASYAIFRLAVINPKGERASAIHLLGRWAIMWLPLLLLISLVLILADPAQDIAFFSGLGLLLVWIGGAAYGAVNPYRGLQDKLAGTWVVRR
ncbi:MAG TPA: RDD family protein, partial [Candidatus Saccharimonadales bacterium]|nr:RDD family protein [Candidatus Saccharimonadales bacterium]